MYYGSIGYFYDNDDTLKEVCRVIPIIENISKELSELYSQIQYNKNVLIPLNQMLITEGVVYGKKRPFIIDKDDYDSIRLETTINEEYNLEVALFVENEKEVQDDVKFKNRWIKLNAQEDDFETMKYNLFTRGIEKDILF